MEPKLSDHQIRVLAEGVKNKGRITSDFVERLYSSSDSAKSCLMTLESWGYIVSDPNILGSFIVIKAPDEAWIIAEKMKEAKETYENRRKKHKKSTSKG